MVNKDLDAKMALSIKLIDTISNLGDIPTGTHVVWSGSTGNFPGVVTKEEKKWKGGCGAGTAMRMLEERLIERSSVINKEKERIKALVARIEQKVCNVVKEAEKEYEANLNLQGLFKGQ